MMNRLAFDFGDNWDGRDILTEDRIGLGSESLFKNSSGRK